MQSELEKDQLDKEKIIDLIQNSLVNRKPIQAWDIHSDNLTISNLEFKAVRKEKNEIEMQTNSIADFENLKKLIKGIGKINFFIGEENLVFYSELKNLTDDGRLLVGMPEKWLIEERRFNERIQTNGLGQINLKNKSITSILTILDVSGTGLSVVLKKIDAKRFKEGTVLEDCRLDILDKKIDLNLKVQRVKSFKHYEFADYPYEVSVIGLSYEETPDEDKKIIIESIEELKKELSQIID